MRGMEKAMLLHFVLAVFLSQAVVAGDATHQRTGVFEKAFPSVAYSYPNDRNGG